LNSQNKTSYLLGKGCLIIEGQIVIRLYKTSIIKRFSTFCRFYCIFCNAFSSA